MPLPTYIMQVIAYSAVFALIYQALLSRSASYTFNRWFLWAALLLPLLLPVIVLPTAAKVALPAFAAQVLPEIRAGGSKSIAIAGHPDLIPAGYLLVAMLLLVRTVIRHLRFRNFLFRHTSVRLHGKETFLHTGIGPGSYGKRIFLAAGTDIPPQVVAHELSHIRHSHYLDLGLVQLLKAICWLNPVLYYFSRQLSLVHEYQADADAAGRNRQEYARQLLQQVFSVQHIALAHYFFHHPIKQRITMLQKNNPIRPAAGPRWAAAVLVLMLAATGICLQTGCTKGDRNKAGIPAERAASATGEQVFKTVDQAAGFNGDINQYLSGHLIYPEAARKAGKQGRVLVRFTVAADGRVRDAYIQRSSGNTYLDQEALRTINDMPAWKPAKSKMQPVASALQLPISFKLE